MKRTLAVALAATGLLLSTLAQTPNRRPNQASQPNHPQSPNRLW